MTPGGMVFHVLNGGVGRRKIFYKDREYAAFERILGAKKRDGSIYSGPPMA